MVATKTYTKTDSNYEITKTQPYLLLSTNSYPKCKGSGVWPYSVDKWNIYSMNRLYASFFIPNLLRRKPLGNSLKSPYPLK